MAKRYVTIDFLRGLAIFLMVFLHTLMRWVDKGYFVDTLATQKIFLAFILISAVFFGAWCGFFLLVSAIGNQISMQRSLAKGMSPLQLGLRQVVGGWILLIFAWLSEGVIGYHGFVGELARYGVDPEMFIPSVQVLFQPSNMLYGILAISTVLLAAGIIVTVYFAKNRGKMTAVKIILLIILLLLLSTAIIFTFAFGVYGYKPDVYQSKLTGTLVGRGFGSNETIHAVAKCVIYNGIVQALLSIKGGYKKAKRNMIIYAVLAVIVMAFTPLIWDVLNPFETGKLGQDSAWYLLWTWVLHGYDGGPEPLFPFLAVSFLGSIIGIWMTQEKPNRKFLKIGLILCLIVFWVGLAGTVVSAVTSENLAGVDELLDHSWTINHLSNKYGKNLGLMWLWWFLCLTAAQTAAVLVILRMIEFRGRGEAFKRGTRFVRRFGFVAFTIYNFEHFDEPIIYLFSLIPEELTLFGKTFVGTPAYNYGHFALNEVWIWPAILAVFLFWQLILLAWEKMDYTFSLEWFIAKIAGIFIPSKKNSEKTHWWEVKRLDAQSGLIDIEPIHYVTPDQVDHEHFEDSRLSYILGIMGWIFFPLTIASAVISHQAVKTEQPNKYLKRARILNTAGLILIVGVFIFSCVFSIYDLTGIESLF